MGLGQSCLVTLRSDQCSCGIEHQSSWGLCVSPVFFMSFLMGPTPTNHFFFFGGGVGVGWPSKKIWWIFFGGDFFLVDLGDVFFFPYFYCWKKDVHNKCTLFKAHLNLHSPVNWHHSWLDNSQCFLGKHRINVVDFPASYVTSRQFLALPGGECHKKQCHFQPGDVGS